MKIQEPQEPVVTRVTPGKTREVQAFQGTVAFPAIQELEHPELVVIRESELQERPVIQEPPGHQVRADTPGKIREVQAYPGTRVVVATQELIQEHQALVVILDGQGQIQVLRAYPGIQETQVRPSASGTTSG